jgi:hypothetical protein
MEIMTELTRWNLTLRDGSIIQVWASSYEERDGTYLFDALAKVPQVHQTRLAISDKTPSDPEQVMVTLVRVPAQLVETVRSE